MSYDCTDSQNYDEYKTPKDIARYVGSTYKYGSDVKQAIEQLQLSTLDKP